MQSCWFNCLFCGVFGSRCSRCDLFCSSENFQCCLVWTLGHISAHHSTTLHVCPLVNQRAENSTCGGSTFAVGGCSFPLSRGPFRVPLRGLPRLLNFARTLYSTFQLRERFFFLLRRSRHFGAVALGNRTALEHLLLHPRSWRLERGASNTCATTARYKCFQLKTAVVSTFPMERFFTRRAGPRATAWQEPHAVEDFLALLRHNAATKLEMELWPPVVKKRRVGKPTIDEQYKRALCDWVATLVELAETLPQAKRLGWSAPGHGAPTRAI